MTRKPSSTGLITVVRPDLPPFEDFVPLLGQTVPPGLSEPEHLLQVVRGLARPGPLDDDFSILTLQIH